jgi:hypothetical protein
VVLQDRVKRCDFFGICGLIPFSGIFVEFLSLLGGQRVVSVKSQSLRFICIHKNLRLYGYMTCCTWACLKTIIPFPEKKDARFVVSGTVIKRDSSNIYV